MLCLERDLTCIYGAQTYKCSLQQCQGPLQQCGIIHQHHPALNHHIYNVATFGADKTRRLPDNTQFIILTLYAWPILTQSTQVQH